jgi:hypothetical protein
MKLAAFYAVLEHSTETVGDHGGNRTEECTRALCVFPREEAHNLCQQLNAQFADKNLRVKMVPNAEPVRVDRFSCVVCGEMVGPTYRTTPVEFLQAYKDALIAPNRPPQHIAAGAAWATG